MRSLKWIIGLMLLVLVILTVREFRQEPSGLAERERNEVDQASRSESGSPNDVTASIRADGGNQSVPVETRAATTSGAIQADLATLLDVRQGSIEGYLRAVVGEFADDHVARMRAFDEVMAMWKEFCRKAASTLRQAEAEGSMDFEHSVQAPLLDAGEFCAGHKKLMADLADVEADVEAEMYEFPDPYPQLEGLDDDSVADFLAAELDRALRQGSLAATITLLGQIDGRNLISITDRNGEPYSPPVLSEIKVSDALATYLLCQRMGGCGANNALVLRLCYGLGVAECTTPRDLFDAIEQLLSGQERFLFEDRLAQIERILLRAR